ncbi:MAG: DUF5808 domain-containing protein [Actinomycetota bacterium]|nr:DUF5808 domain-containing protein [Actinomycetota bacterium]
MTKLRRLMKLATLGLLLGAIREEMNKPEEDRTWNGMVAGIVPYDFRPPTFDRLKTALWNPDDERLITPHPWGVGWTINMGRLVRVVKALARS